jgi:hypothetical protein
MVCRQAMRCYSQKRQQWCLASHDEKKNGGGNQVSALLVTLWDVNCSGSCS